MISGRSLSRISGVIITKKESFPKRRSPNMGLAGNDSLEKPPMLLDELDSGFSNSSFSFSLGQPSIGAPLIFIIPCISVNGKFIGEINRQRLLFHFTEHI